ncbi:MAG: polyprenyl synthetase family protein [Lachnospiraceae bacterium]|nr:polyprenyl synthetase family protein [Lachnospiraceae bacterium]
MRFEEELRLETDRVNEIIHRYLPAEEGFQRTVNIAMNYSINAGGKRLRPIIMQETYRLFDGHSRIVEPFMAAMEMIHTSSLIHDDLPCMDNDELRRGQKTVWAAFGEDMAVLAGDALLLYAFETAAKAFSLHESPLKIGKAMQVLAEKSGINGMVGGQTLDVEKSGDGLSEEELDYIYVNKTAELLEASMMIGAILADASNEDVRLSGEIARKIGVAFQIRDDILDVTADAETLGKPSFSDEKNNKTTFVSLHGIEAAERRVQELTDEAIHLMQRLTGENRFLTQLFLSLVGREK